MCGPTPLARPCCVCATPCCMKTCHPCVPSCRCVIYGGINSKQTFDGLVVMECKVSHWCLFVVGDVRE